MDQQLGLEATPAAYLARLVEVFAEVKRVLRPEGVLWVNVGDSYASGQSPSHGGMAELGRKWRGGGHKATTVEKPPKEVPAGYRQGDLLGIPHRLAQALQADGWIWRADCVWVKAAAMPESVAGWRWERCRVKVKEGGRGGNGYKRMMEVGTSVPDTSCSKAVLAQWSPCPGCSKCERNGGYVLRKGSWRPTKAHESVFLFAKSPQYFMDGEAVRTRIEESTRLRDTYSRILDDPGEQFAVKHDHETVSNPAGANLRDWWLLNTQGGGLDEAHYAAFPPSLPAICIKAGTSERGVCSQCGTPWARVIEASEAYKRRQEAARGVKWYALSDDDRNQMGGLKSRAGGEDNKGHFGPEYATLGWRPTCACADGEPVGALVLDPFVGAGTSGIVARRLGRRFIGIDLSAEYCAMSRRRIAQDQPLFNGAPPA